MATFQDWKFEVDISNNDWWEVSPFHNSFDIQKNVPDNDIFTRFKTGRLLFKDADYELLEDLFALTFNPTMRVSLNDVEQVQCKLNLLGATWNADRRTIEVNTTVLDDYFTLMDNMQTEVDVIDNSLDIWTIKAVGSGGTLFFSTSSLTVGSSWASSGGTTAYAEERKTVTDYQASLLIGNDGWTFVLDNGDGTQNIARDWSGIYATPSFSTNWGIYDTNGSASPDNRPINTVYNYSDLSNPTSLAQNDTVFVHLYEVFNGGSGEWDQYGVLFNVYYDNLYTYTRARKFFDVVKYLVQQIDSAIQFDETGTTTDSFYYFKTYQDGGSDYTLKEMFVEQITDFLLNDDGTEKSNPAEIGNLTLQKLFDFLKNQFWIFWKLEDRSGTPYLVFKHGTEISQTLGNPDATNYFGVNWTAKKNTYTYASNLLFKLMKRDTIASNLDFIGKDIEKLNSGVDTVMSYAESTFYTDIWDMQDNPGKYPDNSVSQFALVSTVREATGFDEIETISNGSPAYSTFSYAADAMTATSAGAANADSASKTLVKGDALYFNYDLTINSGATPVIRFDSTDYTLTAGSGQTLYTNTVKSGGSFTYEVNVSGASDFVLTFNNVQLYYYNAIESTGAISSLSVTNASLSRANCDDEHIARMPYSSVVVNGATKNLSASQQRNVREVVYTIPLEDFADFDPDYLINTDLGSQEIISISIQAGQGLAEIKTRY